MASVMYEGVKDQSNFQAEWSVCDEPACRRRYDPHTGYFDAGEGISVATQPMCDEHGTYVYLESFDSTTGAKVWRCPCANCATEKVIAKLAG